MAESASKKDNRDELYIEENKTILDAMQRLNTNIRKILFVHREGKLLATVTDGDIRRCILKNGVLQMSIKFAANYHPKYLYEEQSCKAKHVMGKYGIEAIPIIDKRHIIKKIIFADDQKLEQGIFEKEIPVIIMAGGQGKRLLPYTNILPKPLMPIGEYPIAEHIINRFYLYGCRLFYMIINYKRNMIKAYFDELDKNYQLYFIEEEKALGTGGGIGLLKGIIKNTFILTNCDIIINDDLTKAYKQHIRSSNLITMICAVKDFTVPYGVVDIGLNGSIKSLREKPHMSFLTNTGCYFVEPEVIDKIEYNVSVDFTQIIDMYIKQGKKVGLYPISEEAWLDMGQIDELNNMKQKYLERYEMD